MAGESFQLFQDRFAAKNAATEGMKFDPASIWAIIQALLPLILGCFAAKPANLKSDRLGNRARVTLALLREMPELSLKEARAVSAQVLAVSDESTDDERAQFIADCCSAN